jgi:hypothetical protein
MGSGVFATDGSMEKCPCLIHVFNYCILILLHHSTGRVVRLEVSILRVMGSYPTQWTSMYVLVIPIPMGQGSGIGLCASSLCAMNALQCMLIVYSHPIPMEQGSVMGLWAPSSVLHTLKIIE